MSNGTYPSASPTSFAETQPMSLPPSVKDEPQAAPAPCRPPLRTVRQPAPALDELSLAPLEVSLYEVMAEVRRANRVCPQLTRWLEFYRILQDAAGDRELPPPPVSGSAWAATPGLAKRVCFHRQVEWAAAHGCLQAAHAFLGGLPDSDWLFME